MSQAYDRKHHDLRGFAPNGEHELTQPGDQLRADTHAQSKFQLPHVGHVCHLQNIADYLICAISLSLHPLLARSSESAWQRQLAWTHLLVSPASTECPAGVSWLALGDSSVAESLVWIQDCQHYMWQQRDGTRSLSVEAAV